MPDRDQKLFNAFLDGCPYPHAFLNKDLVFVRVNDKFARLFGYDASKMSGLNCAKFLPPDIRNKILDAIRTKSMCIADESSEISSIKPNFHSSDRRWEISPLSDIKGEIEFLQISVKDGARIRPKDGEVRTVGEKFEASSIDSPTAVDGEIAKRKEAAEIPGEYQQRLELALRGGDLGFWDWDLRTGGAIVNDRWMEMLEIKLPGNWISFADFAEMIHIDDKAMVNERVAAHLEGRTPFYNAEVRMFTKSGKLKWIDSRGQIFERDAEGKPVRIVGTHLDITERKVSEERINRLNRVYSVLSGINEAIVRIRDEHRLYERSCQIAVEKGGFRMAWVGMIDENSGIVKAICSAGIVEGYLDSVQISGRDDSIGRGPTGICIREGHFSICADFMNDSRMEPWREEALKRGYRSSAAFPLRKGDKVVGSFTLYSGEEGFFNEEEIQLLNSLAEDISFAVEFLRVEQQRRQAEVERDLLFNYSIDLFCVAGFDGFFKQMNPAWEKTLGWTTAELTSKPWLEFVHPEDIQSTNHAFADLKNGKSVFLYENRYLCRDGSYRRISWNVIPLVNEQILFCVARDVTEQKRAEDIIRLAGTYNRSLIEASLDPLVTIGPDGKITDVNRATEVSTGLTRNELIGTDFSNYFTDPDWARAGYQEVFREGTVRDYALELKHVDGHTTPVLYNASRYLDEASAVIGVFAAARDVTERKKAEDQIRRAGAYNRSLIEASLDPLVTIGPDGKITDVNSATEATTGLSRDQLIGTDFCNYFTDPDKARAGYLEVFREGTVRDYALDLKHTDGHITPVLYNASLYLDETGAVIGIFAVARDVTKLKLVEERVRRLYEELELRVIERTAQLEASNKELESFSYSVSHDLRAPLRAIDGFCRLLIEDHRDKLDAEGKRYLEVIRKNTQDMGQLIEDLLSIARIGRQELQRSAINMRGLAQEVFDNLKTAISGRVPDFATVAMPDARGDRMLMRLVLTNLLSNAIKFSQPREDARIEIGGRVEENENVYYVKDNGVGFDMQYAGKLFGIFQRLHRKEEFEGTGVGLAIVHRIMSKHGGRVWAEGKVDEGATFYIALPKTGE